MSGAAIEMRVAGLTDVGAVRDHNEDAFTITEAATARVVEPAGVLVLDVREMPVLLAASDGMGGANAGEVASALTLDALRSALAGTLGRRSPEEALLLAVGEAHCAVMANAQAPDRRGMGATLVAALVLGERALVASVGDSRAYLLRSGSLVQVTRDQSLLQHMIDSGLIEQEEVNSFPHKNIILQAIGTTESLSVPIVEVMLRRGDRLLLCTDGLSGEVEDQEIEQALQLEPAPDEACSTLVALAIDYGGHDNVSVIVAAFDGDGLPAPATDEPISSTVRKVLPPAQ